MALELAVIKSATRYLVYQFWYDVESDYENLTFIEDDMEFMVFLKKQEKFYTDADDLIKEY